MPKPFPRILIQALLLSVTGALGANPNFPLDRAYTLKNGTPFLLENEHDALARDTARILEFAFPRPCRSSSGCEPTLGWSARDSSGGSIAFSPLIAEEARLLRNRAWSTEAGGVVSGGKGPASFRVDARLYTEMGRDGGAASFDREDVDIQTDSVTGAVSYASYARYRGDFDLDLPFGRLTAARDALHWGPGLLTNLTFHQDAVPFNFLSYSGRIGPVSVTSVYGKLLIGSSAAFSPENREDRNLYAHRYELNVGRNWLIGVSEQLILYNDDNAFLFTPVFPLFISKGLIYEETNNGNLSFDVTRRFPGFGILYGEFLLDDLESPSSLIMREYAQNKWGIVAGAHLTGDILGLPAGLIAEYSRIEPWTYGHFQPNTSQTANMGYPLGNQAGPNSQTLVGKIYARLRIGWYASMQVRADWKGRDPGSDLNDPSPENPLDPKSFLAGNVDPKFEVAPLVSYTGKRLGGTLSGILGEHLALNARVMAWY